MDWSITWANAGSTVEVAEQQWTRLAHGQSMTGFNPADPSQFYVRFTELHSQNTSDLFRLRNIYNVPDFYAVDNNIFNRDGQKVVAATIEADGSLTLRGF